MVTIKDFGMPSCCINCDMCLPCALDEGLCHITQHTIGNIYDERPSDCPLVEIQPLTDQEQFKAKAKEIIDNEQFGGFGKLFDYDNIDEICVAQVDDINNAVASYPLMEFLDSLYEQIKGDLK